MASLISWGFLGSHYPDNKGWCHFVYTMGTMTFVMFLSRFLLFHLYESPKFLLSQNGQTEAVGIVHGLAKKNGTKTWLTEEILNEIGGEPDIKAESKLSIVEVVKQKLSAFSGERFGPIFADRKLAINTVLLWSCWLTIEMGYPLFSAFLPQYLKNGKGSAAHQSPTIKRTAIMLSLPWLVCRVP